MKKKRHFHFSLRIRFTLFVITEITLITFISEILIILLNKYFEVGVQIPDTAWGVLISVVLGSAITTFLGKRIFDPIQKLGEAMDRVAGGDFEVRLDDKCEFKEIRAIYENFNLMARELHSTEILQTDFVSNVSHEFKTPINAIEGYATLLQGEDHLLPDEQSQYIEKILFNTKRLSKLVGNILLLSKVDNQSIQTKQSTFRIDEQIRQSVVLLEPEWAKKEIDFDVDLEVIEYTGNENLMLHVWSNLIGNAIKFSPQNGFIGIKLKKRDGKIIYTIADNGPGIPEDMQKHIFERFYQSDSSHKEEGNGLGLALVKQIVELSGGKVEVENIPSAGCRFTVTLFEIDCQDKQ